MSRQEKSIFTLTTSGYEYDKELAKVSIKVIPALQALIANQHDLAETLSSVPEKRIFLETHFAELSIVEETIAKAHAKYRSKREEAKSLKQEKESNKILTGDPQEFNEQLKENDALLDDLAAKMSPGLPSSKFTTEKKIPILNEDKDVRRIAIGASVNALSNLLGRQLTEKEILLIEKQVDSYL